MLLRVLAGANEGARVVHFNVNARTRCASAAGPVDWGGLHCVTMRFAAGVE